MQATVQDLMTRIAVTILHTATLGEALEKLLNENVGEVFVVDEDQRFLGVVTDYELLKAQLDGTGKLAAVETLTSRNIAVARPQQNAQELVPLFRDGRRQRIAVVENDRIVGQVSRLDILRLLMAAHAPRAASVGLKLDEACQRSSGGPRFARLRELPAKG